MSEPKSVNSSMARTEGNKSEEPIFFTREMDFLSGSAFMRVWHAEDDQQATTAAQQYIKEMLIMRRTASIGERHGERLMRRLLSMAHEFDPLIHDLLVAVLSAAMGFFDDLDDYAEKQHVFSKPAHYIFYGDKHLDETQLQGAA